MPQDNAEVLERLDTIESLLQRVIERTELVTERHTTEMIRERETRRPRVESISESSTDAESLYRQWIDLLHRPEHTCIHAPTPRHVGPSLDNNCWHYSVLSPHNAQLEFNHPCISQRSGRRDRGALAQIWRGVPLLHLSLR